MFAEHLVQIACEMSSSETVKKSHTIEVMFVYTELRGSLQQAVYGTGNEKGALDLLTLTHLQHSMGNLTSLECFFFFLFIFFIGAIFQCYGNYLHYIIIPHIGPIIICPIFIVHP